MPAQRKAMTALSKAQPAKAMKAMKAATALLAAAKQAERKAMKAGLKAEATKGSNVQSLSSYRGFSNKKAAYAAKER